MVDKIAIRDGIISYGKRDTLYLGKNNYFTQNPEADALILNDHLAFVIGVILDQGQRAERVWAIPFELKKRLGHLDPFRIAQMTDTEIQQVFENPSKLHRYWKTMALRVRDACKLIVRNYEGNVSNIWNDTPRTDDLQRRFEEFNGIGQKKASMAANILVRDFGIPVRDRKGIDVSNDIHVRRVFVRTGLVENGTEYEIIQVAREINSEYPGELDFPAWDVGRTWCHPTNPNCKSCPINESCGHRTSASTS